MAAEESLLLVHLMDGLGITKSISSGDIYVDFLILRGEKIIKNWQSKHIRKSKLMVWDHAFRTPEPFAVVEVLATTKPSRL